MIEYLPKGHLRQVEGEDAPAIVEYDPAEHGMQSDAAVLPVDGRYFPLSQLAHVDVDEAPIVPE